MKPQPVIFFEAIKDENVHGLNGFNSNLSD